MRKLEELIPHVKLSYENEEGKQIFVGGTQITLEESGYGTNKIMGVNEANIKYGGSAISCDVSFPIYQSMIRDVALNNSNNELNRLFNMNNQWTIEFGWSNKINHYKLSGMRIFEMSISYEADIKSFMANLKLIPKYNYLLTDITLAMVGDEVGQILQAMKNKNDTTDDLMEWGHPLSLGSVITRLLEGCKRILSGGQVIFDTINTNTESSNAIPINQYTQFNTSPAENTASFVQPQNNESLDTKRMSGEWFNSFVSHRYLNGVPDDIPNPSEIRLVLFSTSSIPDMHIYAVAAEFNSEPMPLQATIQKLSESKNYDTNILQFITAMLQENGYGILATPHTVNRSGKLQWMILQTDINNIGVNVDEEEFEGVNLKDGPKLISNTDNKFVNTFCDPNNKEQSQLFDLHSARNDVISITVSTDAGTSTYATARAAEAISEAENIVPGGENITRYKDSMFSLVAKQSHEINVDVLGMPEMKIGDNFHVKLGGEIFSGKYKIIELEHKLSDSFETSIRAIRLMPTTKDTSTKDKPEIIDNVDDTTESRYEKSQRERFEQPRLRR